MQRRPASKNPAPVPYVRHGMPTTKNKGHRARWGRSILTWESLTGQRLHKQLHKDKILTDWEGRTCPRCGNGVMGPLKYYHDKKIWAYRCKKRACHKQLQPHDYHPIFFMSAGNSSTPLQKQVAVLFCAVAGVSSNAAHLLLDMDHKPVERIYHNLEVARSHYVTQKEKDIVFGGKWEDVEVDKVDTRERGGKPQHEMGTVGWTRGARKAILAGALRAQPHPHQKEISGARSHQEEGLAADCEKAHRGPESHPPQRWGQSLQAQVAGREALQRRAQEEAHRHQRQGK